MTTRVRTRNTWFMGMLMFIVLGLIFVSCNSDDGGNPISPQGGEDSDFIASQGQTDQWGAYYTEGAGSFYVNVPQAGDYQLKYTTQNGGPYYITFDTPERAILEVGLQSGDELADACVSSGTIAVPEQTANVGIKYSWKVTVYSVTDAEGDNVSWWNPGSDAQMLFTADPNGENVCVIQDGQLGAGIVEIDPPDKGGDGGGTTPPPANSLVVTATGTAANGGAAELTVSCTGGTSSAPGASVTVTNPTGTCTVTITTTGAFTNLTVAAAYDVNNQTTGACSNIPTTGAAFTVSNNLAFDASSGTMNCPTSCAGSGKVISGSNACWRLGSSNQACANTAGAVCSTDLSNYHGDTHTFVGGTTGTGNNAACLTVLQAFNPTTGSYGGSDQCGGGTEPCVNPTTTTNGTSLTLGCIYHLGIANGPGWGNGYRFNGGSTDANLSHPLALRICGCNQ